MSKGNLFLGFGRGKVGDVVFSRQGGEQITRARNRAPKNPKTPLQLLQRVVMKTTSEAYSLLQPIANHSFQGSQEGTPNQSRFVRRNVDLFRQQLASLIDGSSTESIVDSAETNFSAKSNTLPELNSYQVSEGTLLPTIVHWDGAKFAVNLPHLESTVEAPTYQQVIDGLGLQRGDQLTFLGVSTNDSEAALIEQSKMTSFVFVRVILDPSDGNLDGTFLSTGAIAHPNERNEGTATFAWHSEGSGDNWLQFSFPGISDNPGAVSTIAAAAVIVSRHVNGVWQRSTQRLALRPSALSATGHLQYDNETDFLGVAVLSYMDETQSSLYLNQANSF